MLTAEENELLTKVGPGTAMGDLMRRYWQPIAASVQLKEEPVRPIRPLGEELTLYRDLSGKLGLIAQRCAHRRVDRHFGIPCDVSIRCTSNGCTRISRTTWCSASATMSCSGGVGERTADQRGTRRSGSTCSTTASSRSG